MPSVNVRPLSSFTLLRVVHLPTRSFVIFYPRAAGILALALEHAYY